MTFKKIDQIQILMRFHFNLGFSDTKQKCVVDVFLLEMDSTK